MTQIVNENNKDNPDWKPRECIFFDPISVDCPIFNPLFGPEVSIIENMATTFRMFGEGSSQFFQDNTCVSRYEDKVLNLPWHLLIVGNLCCRKTFFLNVTIIYKSYRATS